MDFHFIQLEILKKLLFVPIADFKNIKIKEINSNLFTYHLNQLISEKLIKKINKKYSLTPRGKEIASTIDTWQKHARIPKQGKIRAICFLFRNKTSDKIAVLQTRLKEPFYNFQGLPCEKVKFGETSINAAERCIRQETGLKGKIHYIGTCHKLITHRGEILEDTYFIVFVGEDMKGNLIKNKPGLLNQWFDITKYKSLKKIYKGTDQIVEKILNNEKNFWIEEFYDVYKF